MGKDPLDRMLSDMQQMMKDHVITDADLGWHRIHLSYLYKGDMDRVQEVNECMARFERSFGKGE